MNLSISVANYPDDTTLPDYLDGIAAAADAAGVDTVWVPDHLMQVDPHSSVEAPMLEAFTTLGYLARASERVRLGALVSAATYRAPALLVKAVTALDVLSGGRAWLGLGAGYQQYEATAMGLDLPAVPERFDRLAETLQIATRMFAGDATPYAGTHYRLEHPVNAPAPASARVPILVGGAGERRTLPLVAQYADACNLFDLPDGGVSIRRKLDVLRRRCADIGRDYDTIERTVATWWAPDTPAADLARHLDTLAGYGATGVVLLRTPWRPADLETLAGLTSR